MRQTQSLANEPNTARLQDYPSIEMRANVQSNAATVLRLQQDNERLQSSLEVLRLQQENERLQSSLEALRMKQGIMVQLKQSQHLNHHAAAEVLTTRHQASPQKYTTPNNAQIS